ncbi:hypothetical protein DOY81_002231 [Sarcophaga bullata]|nr:hypothetical protein DOY81_002231 [Sarcophaga bullata]
MSRLVVQLFIQIYLLLIIQSLILADNVFSSEVKCFENYIHQLNYVNKKFVASLEACEEENNENRFPPQAFDPETEKKKLEMLSKETCSDLTACNSHQNSREFFNCHSKISAININKFIVMHFNASLLVIELNTDHTEEEKEIFRCHLSAKRTFIKDFTDAYSKHLKCLNN